MSGENLPADIPLSEKEGLNESNVSGENLPADFPLSEKEGLNESNVSEDNLPADIPLSEKEGLNESNMSGENLPAGTPLLRRGRGRLIIISAPSGSGKSTIINWLMEHHPELRLAFSISCTSRAPRGTEQNGVEYFFLSPEEFRERIERNEFLEYEEVYEGRFYGTLKEQVERQRATHNVVFDVDVKGGCNIKKYYGDEALSLFIQPPSIEELRRRLEGRGTDAPEVIEQRLERAAFELSFAPQFDRVVINDDLQTAEEETFAIISQFL
ncbi:MAG: guanylate kinase [Prevotella sp.]|nr:guanylate kinase [Prevotella sp.]